MNYSKRINPNLFLIGFQKCGSSTLFSLLTQHPEVEVSFPKETFALVDKDDEHFSNENSVLAPDFSWGSYFPNQKKCKYALEASVCNFYQKTALEYISNLPQKKVIFIVRDPIQRFRSAFEYYGPRITTFGPITSVSAFFDLISIEQEKMNVAGAKYALEHGKYVKYINQWENAIGRENIQIVGFSNLIKSPETVMNGLCKFLEIELQKNMSQLEHKNKTKVVKNKKLDFYARKIFAGTGIGKSFLGNFYQKINRTGSKSPVDVEVHQKLKEIYRAEYENLSAYF